MTLNSNILAGLNDPFLPVKACFYRFQPFFVRTGPHSTRTGCCSKRTAAKNLEERDRTWQRSIPCLSTVFDRSVLSRNISSSLSVLLVPPSLHDGLLGLSTTSVFFPPSTLVLVRLPSLLQECRQDSSILLPLRLQEGAVEHWVNWPGRR